MDTALDVFVFPEPWWDLRGQGVPEAERRQHLLDEARAELGPQHPLATGDLDVLADLTRQDEVLFRCSEDAFAIVHLTYAGALDPFVRVRLFDSWSAVRDEIEAMAEDW